MKLKMYPNEQLGKTNAVMEQLKLGTVHVYAEGSTYMKKWMKDITWMSAAFLFDDREHWVRFMNTDMVEGWFREGRGGCRGHPARRSDRESCAVRTGSW